MRRATFEVLSEVALFITNREILLFHFFNLRELSVNEFQEEPPYNASLEALLISVNSSSGSKFIKGLLHFL